VPFTVTFTLDALEAFRSSAAGRPLLLTLGTLVLVILVASRSRSTVQTTAAVLALAVVGAIGLLLYPAVAIWYGSDPHFFDNAEPTIVSVAWVYRDGAPLYHAIDAAARYSHIYGPMAFMPYAWVLTAFGPSIAVAKWFAVATGFAALAFTYGTARRECSTSRSLVLTGGAALTLLSFRNYSFWTRPDSLQILCAAMSVYFAGGRRSMPSTIMAGAASGVLWNLKITGVLYSLPVLASIKQRFGMRAVALATLTGAAIAVAPFFLSNVSLGAYLAWVRQSSATGLLLLLLRQNLEWAAFLSLPILLSRNLGEPNRVAERRDWVVGALAVGMLLVALAAAKPGAGPYHMLPFVPVIVFVVARRAGRRTISELLTPPVARVAIAFVIVLVMLAITQSAQLMTTMQPRRAARDVEDLQTFLATHTGTVEMAYGTTEAQSLLRPLLTFRNHTYLIDQPAVREYQLQGLDLPAATIDAVRDCRVHYWLTPKNERPFSGLNGYPSVLMKPLYSRPFLDTFFDSYRRTETTAYYDVWTCTASR